MTSSPILPPPIPVGSGFEVSDCPTIENRTTFRNARLRQPIETLGSLRTGDCGICLSRAELYWRERREKGDLFGTNDYCGLTWGEGSSVKRRVAPPPLDFSTYKNTTECIARLETQELQKVPLFWREYLLSLIPIPTQLMIRALFDMPKTIRWGNKLCEVLETREDTRTLQPILTLSPDGEIQLNLQPFFTAPRRATNKTKFLKEKILRQYRTGIRIVFPAPLYTGDVRPTDVDIVSSIPDLKYAVTIPDYIKLIRKYGYPPQAAWTSLTHSKLPPPSDRRRKVVRGKNRDGAHFAQPLPYTGAPTRHTHVGGGFSLDDVLWAASQMRGSPEMRQATIEVVHMRRSPRAVAAATALSWQALRKAANRLRGRIRAQRGQK